MQTTALRRMTARERAGVPAEFVVVLLQRKDKQKEDSIEERGGRRGGGEGKERGGRGEGRGEGERRSLPSVGVGVRWVGGGRGIVCG